MSITAESTAADDQNRARREGPELWSRTKPLLDELVAARLELERLRAAMPDDAHARQCRTADLEALVLQALANATLHADVLAVHPRFRATKVIKHLARYKERYGIKKPPCAKTIRKIMEQHGYMELVATS